MANTYEITEHPFRPVRCKESDLSQIAPMKGYIYFTMDTKKIFYCDGESFLAMGGNSSIFYGLMVPDEETDSDQVEFDFLVDQIDGNEAVTDGNYKVPMVDDLILNIDGCFYRVVGISGEGTNTIIHTNRLTVAGSNTGGASSYILQIYDLENTVSKYPTADTKVYNLQFYVVEKPSGAMESNEIVSIKVRIGSDTNVIYEGYVNEGKTWQFNDIITFDIGPYISSMSTSVSTRVNFTITDLYGKTKNHSYNILPVELLLQNKMFNTDKTPQEILLTKDGVIPFTCMPQGGGTLVNRKITFNFYDANGLLLGDWTQTVAISKTDLGNNIYPNINIQAKGAYSMEVIYSGKIESTSQVIQSNILKYSIVYYDENPVLVAYIPSYQVEQYSTLNIAYLLAADLKTNDTQYISLFKNSEESEQEVFFNQIYIWSIYFDTPGNYNLRLEDHYGNRVTFNNVEVYEYAGEIPVIDVNDSTLELNLTTVNRSNNELYKDSWSSKGVEYSSSADFINFAWKEINGWLVDDKGINMLRLSSGAKLIVNFEPFAAAAGTNRLDRGLTIELDFKVHGVTDFNKTLISCLSHNDNGDIQVGFNITGQESTFNTEQIKATGAVIKEGDDAETQAYNTAVQGLTTKFIENERIHLTLVIQSNTEQYPMIETYLNGIVSGITQYTEQDRIDQNNKRPAKFIFDSTYGVIDIYNIRVYGAALSAAKVLNNYIATLGSAEDRTKKYLDNSKLLNNNNQVSIDFENDPTYILSVPYIKITGGEALSKNEIDGNYYLSTTDNEKRLPRAKKDYRLVREMIFIDQNHIHENRNYISTFKSSGVLNGIAMYGQGTSSMEYPIKNLRFKWKMKDENDKKVKFVVNADDWPVDIICFKADYMESSGSHNTGTANFIFDLLSELKYQTPGQEYYNAKYDYSTVTTIRGYPVLIFFRPDEQSNYEFIGKYNLNIDKAAQEPFGFIPVPEPEESIISEAVDSDGNETWQYVGLGEKAPGTDAEAIFGWMKNDKTGIYSQDTISDYIPAIHCYEVLNNTSALGQFKGDHTSENRSFKDYFFATSNGGSSNKNNAPNWFVAFESRYPEGDSDNVGSDIDIASWYRVCEWLNSTDTDAATNNAFNDNYVDNTYGYTHDSAEFRLQKFINEFEDYFNLEFTAFYYVLTHVLLMIDSRAKNMMIATWDNIHWYPIFYDMDTMLGLNNYGYNKFHYDIEDTAANIYNGQNSILWNNFRRGFADMIAKTYNEMQSSGMTYNKALSAYNDHQADAVNETIYNADSKYKYKDPYINGYYESLSGDITFVAPGKKDYLYASQGPRSMHRKWWLKNRFNFMDGKYLSDIYKADKYTMRLYTPSAETDNYSPRYNITEEEFNKGTYYIYNSATGTYTLAETYDSSIEVYYVKDINNKLQASLEAVPHNNNFTLIPLNNQYLSVGYGGDNGDITTPVKANAGVATHIKAPSDYYNDTETYIYGGSLLKSLGDLSSQYLGLFKFPDGETKLETLILGNKHNNYYNYNFSSLTIGTSAPYLKHLNIMNCSGLANQALDVGSCTNLQEIYATGSNITGITLPIDGVLKELRLPNTVTSLKVEGQAFLEHDNFTMGTYDSDSNTYSKNDYSKLIRVEIINTPGLNSYEIIKGANALQRFNFQGVNWIIDSAADIDTSSETIIPLAFLQQVNEEQKGAAALGGSLAQSVTGTVTIATNIVTEIGASTIIKIVSSYGSVFPDLKFVFEKDAKIYMVTAVDGNGNEYWYNYIAKNNILTKEFLSTGPLGALTIPVMRDTQEWQYTFENKWLFTMGTINQDIFTDDSGLPIDTTPITNDVLLIPSFNKQHQKYLVSFYNKNEDGSLEEILSGTYEYGTTILSIMPTVIPYKDDTGLERVDACYKFIGYNTKADATYSIEFTDDYVVTTDVIYYAIFVLDSIYNNLHLEYWEKDESFTNYIDPETEMIYTGVSIRPITSLNLKGKVLVPNTFDGQPVISLANGAFKGENANTPSAITHVFFEKDDNNKHPLVVIEERACSWSGIQYFEFTSNLRAINNYAFYQSRKLTNADLRVCSKLYRIGLNAFRGTFTKEVTSNFQIFIPASVQIIEEDAFSYPYTYNNTSNYVVELYIGDQDNYSILNLAEVDSSTSGTSCIMATNDDKDKIDKIYFYSKLYNSLTEECTDAHTGEIRPIYQVLKNKELNVGTLIYFYSLEGEEIG